MMKEATHTSTDQNEEERFVKKLSSSQNCPVQNEFSNSPEVAAGVSQSFSSPNYGETFLTSSVTQQNVSAANSTVSYASPTMYVGKEKDSQNPKNTTKNSKDILYPYNAEYLINHVLYLPVHKKVPLWYLEYICIALEKVMKDRPGVKFTNGKTNIVLPSKL